jgi:3-hydroxy acid dehydrogenase/malonic semialdehyde reductase
VLTDDEKNRMTKTVFITGASSGIGYAAALAFARAGWNVAVTARRQDRLKALAQAVETLPQPHGDILTLACDVRDGEAVQAAVSLTVTRFGRLDVAVANAGIGQRGAVVDSPWEDLETLLRTNIDGVLHTVRAAVPEMRKQGGGHIILISSIVANMTAPYAASYSASKAFVSSMARSLMLELEADQIRVVDMRVGRTETEFSARRLGASGHAAKAPRLPVMSADYVAERIVRASQGGSGTVVLRWFDRMVVWANALMPQMVGRRALRQYKT